MKKWSILTPTALFLVVLSVSNCEKSDVVDKPLKPLNTEPGIKHARQEWLKLDKELKSAVGKVVRRAMPMIMKEVYKKEVSAPCLGALMGFTKALRESKLWAYKMLDSSGRFPEGFLHGTLTDLGNYEECVEIFVNETKQKLQGQYCTLNIVPPVPEWKPFTSAHVTVPELVNISAPDTVITYLMGIIHNLHVTSLKIGICTPSKCTKEDVNKLVDIIPEQLGVNWAFHISHCEIRDGVKFTGPQIIVLYVLGILSFFVLVGTVVDRIWTSEEMEKSSVKSTLFHLVKAFSFTANAKKLSNYSSPRSELDFVYGVIVLVFCWNVISNTFMYVNYDTAANFVEALRILQHLFYEIALNRILPLQVLFFLSGFVTTYKCMKSSERSLNVIKFILKKYLRFTPAYGLLLAIIILTPVWGSGPSWASHMDPVYNNCRDNWWYNILYINNFLDPDKACLTHTWIFGVAAQLHLIAIVILIPLKLYPKVGLMLNFVLAVASLASVALTNVYYDLPPNEMAAILSVKDRNFYAAHTYNRVYTHVGLFCTGIFVGYFLAKNPNIKISRKMSILLWLLTGTALMTALCVVHEWRKGIIPSPLHSAVYTSFSKVAEAAFMAWMTVACMTRNSGGLRDILGWRPFAFFGRLSFIAYIMHVPIMNMVMNFKKAPVFICELEIFYMVLSHAAGTYLVSYVFHLFLEAPWISLADVIFRRNRGRTFNSELPQQVPITEKPVKYSEKVRINSRSCVNSLEKGQN